MKIVSIVGTRPNFTKEYVICEACKKNDIEEIIVHTGQHYDYAMSQKFFQDLKLPQPKYINEIIKGAPGYETATMLAFIEQVLLTEKPDITLVYGDVNSTIAGAIASVKQKIPVAHIEAGLRTPFFYNPEEINRRIADTVSEFLFPHIQCAYDSLINEGYPKENIFFHGDIVNDAVLKIVNDFNINVTQGDYYLLTIHRAENADSKERLTNIINALIDSGKNIKFPVHPRTLEKLHKYGIYDKLEKTHNIEMMNPLGFIDFIKLLAGCKKFITDSGSARREGYILNKPIITLINIIWVKEMVDIGWDYVTDDNHEKIIDSIENHEPDMKNHKNIFGDGHAADKIINTLVQWKKNK